MSKHDWRTTLGSIVRDFRRTWPQLLAADLLCRVAIYLLLSPLVALVARFFISRSGDAVLTDEEILFFFLRPAGLTALIVVGALTLAIAFAESAIIMTIGFAAAEDRKFAVLDSFRYVYRRFVRLVRLGARLLVRILLLTVPFLAAVALVYYLLLTGSDINFYLTFRPPRFWVALILAGTLGLVWLTLLARALLGWAFALPIVLFEAVGPRVAIRTSLEDTRGRRRELTAWLVAWILLGVGLSAMATAAIGGLGRAVIPTTGGTLPVVAFLVGTVLILSALANLAISFLSTAFLGLIVVGLYRRSTGRGSMGRALDGQKRLAGPAVIRLPRRAWRWIGFAAVAAAAIYATVLSLNVPVGDSIEITAHRGSSGLAPENTMAAVEQAIVDGADWVEIDVQETADGIVVVHHDSDFRKIAGSRLRIWEATYEELRSLDIGSWFAPEFSGERLPTLEDVLLASKDRIRVNIELKHYGRARRLEEAVIEVVEKTGMESQIAIMSLKRESIQRARALRPEWTVGFLSAAAIGNLTRIDADFLAVNSGLATRSLIRAAHRRGQEVHVWTINDPAAMSALIGRGVDNLITDFPAVARSVLAQRAEMTTIERLLVDIGSRVRLLDAAAESTEDDA